MMKQSEKRSLQHVFVIGAKSLGAYGGYETFVQKLTEYHQEHPRLRYHIVCKANGDGHMDESKLSGVERISDSEFRYQNARCFKIKLPSIGPAQAICYDVAALHATCKYIAEKQIPNAIVYILACRIGPFMGHYARKLHRLGAKVYVNPDGHEWLRAKWSKLIRRYWKYSERRMVKHADLVICDSVNIQSYIHHCYDGKGVGGSSPRTEFIAYGAETRASRLSDTDARFSAWLKEKGLVPQEYYLVVGRFVPENNYECMIREFMQSDSKKNFALISNVNTAFLQQLQSKLQFHSDPRIRFVGTVYDQELLMKIREQAYAYFHGHEVGGTNPSLLEALGATQLNLLLDVGFNREVAQEAALYWSKTPGDLAALIHRADALPAQERQQLGERAKARIRAAYSWEFIAGEYERVFLDR